MQSKNVSGEVFPIFPTPVYIGEIEVSNEEFDYIKNIKDYNENDMTRNKISKDIKILKRKELKNINMQIVNHLNHFSKDVLQNEFDIAITISWLNKKETGSFHHEHSHPNSVISGVLYFSECEPIIFTKHHATGNENSISNNSKVADSNMYTARTFFVKPSKGKLLLFPSYLRHYVAQNELKEDRYSLSFNSFPKFSVGSHVELTLLEFNDLI